MDECSQDDTPCGANEECLNDQGTYSCVCRAGYRKKNKVCTKEGERLKKLSTSDNFTVVCSVTWPLNGSEAAADLVTSLLSLRELSCCYSN